MTPSSPQCLCCRAVSSRRWAGRLIFPTMHSFKSAEADVDCVHCAVMCLCPWLCTCLAQAHGQGAQGKLPKASLTAVNRTGAREGCLEAKGLLEDWLDLVHACMLWSCPLWLPGKRMPWQIPRVIGI